MVEAIVAVGVIGVAFTSCLGALALMNSIASISRNYTGAYVALERRIDWVLTAAPFNPQKICDNCPLNPDGTRPKQIPEDDKKDSNGNVLRNPDGTPVQIYAKLAPGTYTEDNVAVYNEAQAGFVNGLLQLLTNPNTPNNTFLGTMTTTVGPTPNAPPYIYSINVTITYKYRNRNYSLSMNTLRTSDE